MTRKAGSAPAFWLDPISRGGLFGYIGSRGRFAAQKAQAAAWRNEGPIE